LISSAVVHLPSENRTAERALSTGKPIASKTCDATTDPTKTTATASPTASGDVIPCLGPRIYGKVAGPDDIPLVAKKPGVMEVDSLTLYNSTYDGVVNMPTAGGGSYKALKFSMDKAVNKPFKLTIDDPGHQTVITSKEKKIEGPTSCIADTIACERSVGRPSASHSASFL